MFRFIKQFSILLAVALITAQCTRFEDIAMGGDNGGNKVNAAKIINNSNDAVKGSLLVKLNDVAAEAFETQSRNGAVTRSNIEPLNALLLDIEATAVERVFPYSEAHEADTRKAGLHRWYAINFDQECDLDEVALALAQIAEVEVIEFNSRVEMPAPQPTAAANLSYGTTRLVSPTFNDPLMPKQWDLTNTGTLDKSVKGMDINVAEAWKYTTGDSSIIVAVVDQGVDYTHEDLKDNMWVNTKEIADDGIDNDKNGYVDDIHGWNFVDNGPISWNKHYPTPSDPEEASGHKYGDVGHGTHVAGTIAAVNGNGKGICGIAGGDGTPNSGVKIMSLQIYSGTSGNNGSAQVIAQAFKYAADHGAVIANCSWGSTAKVGENDGLYTQSRSVQHEAMEAYRKKSCHPNINRNIIICAAGNDSTEQAGYPGGYRDYISVTSFGINGLPAYYTNYGPGCNISAPGGDLRVSGEAGILSTISAGVYEDFPENYGYQQGTSMACPHVTGVAALGLAYAKKLGKKLNADEFKAMILLSVNDMDSYLATSDTAKKYVGMMGTGRIDAFRMLMNIEGITCIPVPRGVLFYDIDLTPYLSDGKVSLKLVEGGVKISSKDMKRLGIENKPEVMPVSNKISITCKNSGSAIMEVKMIAGGDSAGTSTSIGGMTITKRFALIVRDNFTTNGGWL